jgi:hypothetical protein
VMTRDAVLSVHDASVAVVTAAVMRASDCDVAVLAALADVPAGMEPYLAARIGDMVHVASHWGVAGLRHAGMAGALARCGLTA